MKPVHRARVIFAFALLALVASWLLARGPAWILINFGASYVWLWLAFGLVTRASPQEHTLRFVLTTTSLGLAVVLLEVLALFQLVDYRLLFRNRIAAPWKDPVYVADPELIYRRPAHFTASGETYGDITYVLDVPNAQPYPFEVHLDRNGFRNPVDLVKADVALLGDLFIEADLVRDEDHVATVLGALRGEVVAGLGSAGYGPHQQQVLLRDYAIPLAPHTVVWLFFEGNDLQNLATWDLLKADVGRTQGRVSFTERSFTHNALERLVNTIGHTGPPARRRIGLVRAAGDTQRTYFLYTTPQIQPRHLEALDRLHGMLRESFALANERNVRLLVAFVPIKYRVYRERLVEAGSVSSTWTLNDMPARVERIVRSISPAFGFVDLTPALIAALDADGPPYFPDDSHWNSIGHRAAAGAIHQAIEAMKPPTGSGSATRR